MIMLISECPADCPEGRAPIVSSGRFPYLAIDLPNLFHPMPPFGVFERQQLVVGPVKVISDIGHLLVQLPEGVA
ncbi:MAG: hypothetical protein LAO21_13535 [Acidobacteriia bacterium]|nr:hypothetical protein [Terriglobia bacterium]